MLNRSKPSLHRSVHAALCAAYRSDEEALDGVMLAELAGIADETKVTVYAGDIRGVIVYHRHRQRVAELVATAEPLKPPLTISGALAILTLTIARRIFSFR